MGGLRWVSVALAAALLGYAAALPQTIASQSHQMSISINAPYRSSWSEQQQAFVSSLASAVGRNVSHLQVLRSHPIQTDRGIQYGSRIDFVVKNVNMSFADVERLVDIAKSDGTLLSGLNSRSVHFSLFDPMLAVPPKDPNILAMTIKLITNSTELVNYDVAVLIKKAICGLLTVPGGAVKTIGSYVSPLGTNMVQMRITTEFMAGVSPQTLLDSFGAVIADGSLVQEIKEAGLPYVDAVQVTSVEDYSDEGMVDMVVTRSALFPSDEEVAQMMGISVTELRSKRAVQNAQSFKIRVGDPRISVKSAGRSTTNIEIA